MTNNIEYLDIVDSNNNIIGQASRLEIHTKNLLHRSAHIFVVYHDLIFLQLRSSNKTQFPNTWDTSAAGHLNAGEDYYNAAVRELSEELGLSLQANQILEELGDILPSQDNGYEFVKIYALRLNYLPNLVFAPDEITTGAWFTKKDINSWLIKQPASFAGCFKTIWDQTNPKL